MGAGKCASDFRCLRLPQVVVEMAGWVSNFRVERIAGRSSSQTSAGLCGSELSPSSAHTVATSRVSTLNFSNISCTCLFTVDSVMPRIVALSGFVLPWANQSSASAARGVRPSFGSGSAEEKLG